MSQSDVHPEAGVATAEPPAPPSSPPTTSTAMPGPNPKRRRSWVVAGVVVAVVLIVLAALALFFWWQAQQPAPIAQHEANGAVESALRKARVDAPVIPATTIDLAQIKATGSHPFDATFTYDELVALLSTFTYLPQSARGVNFTVNSLVRTGSGELKVYGDITSRGMSLRGWIQGPVKFSGGKIVPNGDFVANTNGLTVKGTQALRTALIAIAYLNAYLRAAPGLKVQSATITTAGIHVTGTAPDRISW
jgi:hypothetical protein